MHVRLPVFLLLWLGLTLTLPAQLYTGAGSLSLTAAGEDAATTLTSDRLNARFTCDPANFRFLIKTAVLGMETGALETALVDEVLLAPSNPLMEITWDGSDLPALCDGASHQLSQHPVTLRVTFNGETVTLPGRLDLQATATTLDLSLEATLSLAAFGLYVRAPHKAVFGDAVTLSLTEVSLIRR